MLLSVAAFTANSLLLKHFGALEHTDIPAMVPLLFRASVGIVIVLVFFRGRRPTLIRPVFTEKRLIIRGMTGLLGTAAYYWTIPALGAAKATLYCNTYVIFAAIIAAIWLGESLKATKVAWLVTAVAGIGLLALTGDNPSGANAHAIGPNELIALGGAIMAAWTVVVIRQLVAFHSNGTIFLAQCVWIVIPIAYFTIPHLGKLLPTDWVLLIIAAACASFGQLAMNEGYRCLTVASGAALQTLWPVATAIGGVAFFSERFLPLQIVGAILILVATWRVAARKTRR